MKNKVFLIYSFIIISSLCVINLFIFNPRYSNFDFLGQAIDKDSGVFGDIVTEDNNQKKDNPLDAYGPTNKEIENFFDKYFTLICVLIIIILIVIIISQHSKMKQVETPETIKLNEKNSLPLEKLQEIIPDFNNEEIISELFTAFSEIKRYYSSFDTHNLIKYLTDNLYLKYYEDLNNLHSENKSHTIRDLTYRGSNFIDVNKNNNIILLTIEMKVSYYDYVENDGRLVDGDRDKKLVAYYELEFLTDINDYKSVCPHCGAPSDNKNVYVCEYCNQEVPKTNLKWLLNKEKIIIKKYSDK